MGWGMLVACLEGLACSLAFLGTPAEPHEPGVACREDWLQMQLTAAQQTGLHEVRKLEIKAPGHDRE